MSASGGLSIASEIQVTSTLVGLRLSALDRSFADLLVRLARGQGMRDAEALKRLRWTALLVSAERADGNSCVELEAYADRTVHLDGEPVRFPSLPEWRRLLLASGLSAGDAPLLVLDGNRLYLLRYHRAEVRLAASIRERAALRTGDNIAASAARFRALFPSACEAAVVDWQAVAAGAALRSSLLFITGGPGTGKTTVAARLLALLLYQDPTLTVSLAAPTGRAAARLSEAIGLAAERDGLEELMPTAARVGGRTLHRLLGYHPITQRFRFHASRPLVEDVVIVDEASMVDVLMMDALLQALKPSARLILLGDPDQLASVDTGFVLGDVARAACGEKPSEDAHHSAALAQTYAMLAGVHPPSWTAGAQFQPLQDAVIRLQVSWRFAQQAGVGRLADATRRGRPNEVLAVLDDAAYTDVSLRDAPESIEALLSPVQAQVHQYLSATTARDALDALARFRVLVALREGIAGVTGLNAWIERWLEQQGRSVAGWYDHRPILITANDPSVQLYNGDVGVVLAVSGVPQVHFPTPEGRARAFAPSQLPMHETAWAMTVHKAQGSEFDHVVLVLPDVASRLMTRELIYTGVTRARRTVTLFGDRDSLAAGVERSVARASGLVQRLREDRGACA